MDLGRLTTVALWMAATGCAAVLGLDEFEDATVSTTSATATGGGTSTTALTTGGGGATTSGGTTGGGGIGGSGGGMLCQPGSSQKCPYMGPMGTEGLGNCVAGHRICNVDGDGYGPCMGEVTPEPSDNCATPQDEDCDGLVNQGCPCTPNTSEACYSGPNGTVNVGPCKAGSHTCNADGMSYGPCMGEVTPVPETCNTVIDDDCNGQTNEGGAGCVCVPNSTATCYDGPNGTQGVGICQAGTQICNDQGTAYLPGCGGEVVPGVETCVGAADENCDGSACGVAQWAKIWGDAPGSQNSKDVATDSGGNVYIVGQFTGAIQFGASALISAGALDVFVAKFDSSGNHLWSKKFGDAANQNASAIAVSTTGDVLVTGYFQGAIDFGGGNLTTAGGSDVFVAKLDTNGNHVWSKRYGDASSQQAFDVGLDSSGNAIVVGIYYGTPNFGAGAFPGPVAGDQGVFWMKLAAATGNTTWAKPFVGGFHTARAVAVDPSGNIIIGGSFSSSLSIGCGSFTASSGEDAFVAKLDANGNCSWFKPFGTTNPQYTFDVAVDSSGGVVAAGNFQTSIAPGGIPLNAVGGFDYWIAKFSTGGTHLWSKAFGSAGGEDPGGLAIASNGDIWLAGTFDQTINLGGALLTSAGSVDVFVGRLDANGNHLWSARYGDSQIQQPGDVALAPSQDLYVTGLTTGAIDFGTGALVSAGGQDAYLAKIGH